DVVTDLSLRRARSGFRPYGQAQDEARTAQRRARGADVAAGAFDDRPDDGQTDAAPRPAGRADAGSIVVDTDAGVRQADAPADPDAPAFAAVFDGVVEHVEQRLRARVGAQPDADRRR